MSNSAAIKAGRADVEVGTNNKPLSVGLSQALARLKTFASNVRAIGSKMASGLASWSTALTGGALVAGLRDVTKTFMDIGSVADGVKGTIGLSDSDVQTAKEMRYQFAEVNKAVLAVKMSLGAALAPLITSVARGFVPILKSTADWIKDNKELVQKIFMIGVGLAAVVGTVAFLATPVGQIVALFGLVTAGILLAKKGLEALAASGSTFAQGILDTFRKITDYVRKIGTGIFDALAGGDAMLAIEIFWKAFQLAALKAIKAIATKLDDLFKPLEKLKAIGIKVDGLNIQAKLGITDEQLKAREMEIEGLLGRAKGKAKESAKNVPHWFERAGSVGANLAASSGAASSIARAYNDPANAIWKQILDEQKKTNENMVKFIAKKPFEVKQFGGGF